MLLQQDNMKCHTSDTTSETIEMWGLKLFHTFNTSQMWRHLSSGCMQLWRCITEEFIWRGWRSWSCYRKWFQEQSEEFYSDGFKTLVQHLRHHIEQEGGYVEGWGTEASYTFWAMFVLFYFNTVSGSRVTNREALLSEHLLYAGWKNVYECYLLAVIQN